MIHPPAQNQNDSECQDLHTADIALGGFLTQVGAYPVTQTCSKPNDLGPDFVLTSEKQVSFSCIETCRRQLQLTAPSCDAVNKFETCVTNACTVGISEQFSADTVNDFKSYMGGCAPCTTNADCSPGMVCVSSPPPPASTTRHLRSRNLFATFPEDPDNSQSGHCQMPMPSP